MCGGYAGFQCEAKLYCAFPVTARCGAGDMAGTCQPKPEMCTDLYAAVCGCDGKTYPNTCYAQRTGVSVASTGACKP
ncbi:MAG: Kazal-type serine protease inhibitor domain-containing protein [Pseudomonadota bacterium]